MKELQKTFEADWAEIWNTKLPLSTGSYTLCAATPIDVDNI
jgi:hypothetical protein